MTTPAFQYLLPNNPGGSNPNGNSNSGSGGSRNAANPNAVNTAGVPILGAKDNAGLLSLREYIESAVERFVPYQSIITLSPNGVITSTTLNYQRNIVIQTENQNTNALLMSLMIDTVPGSVGVSVTASAYNQGQFGAQGTINFQNGTKWNGNNIITPNQLVLISRTQYLNFAFTNLSYYDVKVSMNWTLGFIANDNANAILSAFGHGRIQ